MTENLQELYRLGESLPAPMSQAAINGWIATRGEEFTRKRLIAAHLNQCTTLCKHLRGVPSGA